jgi:hypothetical protein
MKKCVFKSLFAASLFSACAVLLAGCSSCKPGKPGPIGKYNVEIVLDDSLKSSSVVVDLVGVGVGNLSRWQSYDMSQYWSPRDPLRTDAQKVTMNFISGKSLTNSLSITNAVWDKWKARGATHLVVLADLPSVGLRSQQGNEDARRLVLPLDECSWPNKTKTLSVLVQRSGIVTVTPMRYSK